MFMTSLVQRFCQISFRNFNISNGLKLMMSTNGKSEMNVANGHVNPCKRGALIVLEGCDKAGKSTQCKMLVEALNKDGHPSRLMTFPDRSTEIGKMIDQYLKCSRSLSDEAIHLLFSANRWEFAPQIHESLQKGETVIVDRYAFSGVAFSAAKGTLSLEWCKGPDVGLPKPDQVFYLHVNDEAASKRGDYGQERYEKKEFQERVRQTFFEIYDESFWKTVDASRSIDQVHEELLKLSTEVISCSGKKKILPLWMELLGSSDITILNGIKEDALKYKEAKEVL